MKIGILTYHRAYNYGAVLQCYALQKVLKGLGNDVEIIDYRQPSVEKYYKLLRFDRFKKSLRSWKSFINFIAITRYNYKRSLPFKHFAKFLKISNKKYVSQDAELNYDAVFVGSDQLLNTEITNGIDLWYSGKFKTSNPCAKKIAYAISADRNSINNLTSKQLQSIIESYDCFSFREQTLARIIEEKTGKNIITCLDPTLLTDEQDWNDIAEKDNHCEDYIVVYEVRKPKDCNALTNLVKAYTKKEKLKYTEISNPFMDVGRWLSYIKNARCVFTSSFHATAFALIFKTPVIAFKLEDGNDARYVDLLTSLGLHDNIKSLQDKIGAIPEYPQDIGERIIRYRQPSLAFIRQSLQ